MTEQERQQEQLVSELQAQADYGRKSKAVQEVLSDFLLGERTRTICALENLPLNDLQNMQALTAYLHGLSSFERSLKTYIDIGEIAQEELNKHGS